MVASFRILCLWSFFMMSTISWAVGQNHVAIFSSTFSGHNNVMLAIASELNTLGIRVSFYLPSYATLKNQNQRVMNDIAKLPNSSVVRLDEYYPELPPLDPLLRTPLQVATLLEPAKTAYDKDPADIIIFDMLAPEGKLIGMMTNTPTIAISAAFEVPKKFARQGDIFQGQQVFLDKIYQFSNIKLEESIIPGAALPFVAGDETYSLMLPQLHCTIPEKISDGITIKHLGPRFSDFSNSGEGHPALDFIDRHHQQQKKIIYLSLGTVVSQKVYNSSSSGKEFVNKIFQELSDIVAADDSLAMVISSGEAPFQCASTFQSEKIAVFASVPQISVLESVDLFITHGGANSVNEAALAGVPMLVIPFFDDQHFCAKAVRMAGLGLAIEHDDSVLPQCMSPLSGIYDRESFNKVTIKQHIKTLINDNQQQQSRQFKEHALQSNRFEEFIRLLENKIKHKPIS